MLCGLHIDHLYGLHNPSVIHHSACDIFLNHWLAGTFPPPLFFLFPFSGCAGSSLQRTGFTNCGMQAYLAVACGLSCPVTCGVLIPWLGIEPCPLHWKANSLPLGHQGSPFPTPLPPRPIISHDAVNIFVQGSLPFFQWCLEDNFPKVALMWKFWWFLVSLSAQAIATCLKCYQWEWGASGSRVRLEIQGSAFRRLLLGDSLAHLPSRSKRPHCQCLLKGLEWMYPKC